jgi:hypothetical protein
MAGGFRAHENKLAGMPGVPRSVCESDHAAERCAIDDGLLDAEHVAERLYVVAPLRQVPGLRIFSTATAIAAMIEVYDLRQVSQR